METTLDLPRLVRYLDGQGETQYEMSPGGTFDDAAGPDQMRAVHHALILYFGTVDWLAARREQHPGI